MRGFMCRFFKSDDGAVTVDWVVLTAGVVGLGLLAVSSFGEALTTASTSIATRVEAD